MSVPLYMDHHVPRAITAVLRKRGVDCLTTQDDATGRLEDDLLLARSTELGRVLFTNDDDFLSIAAEWLSAGREFAGLAYAEQLGITIGQAIADLEIIAMASDPDEWKNRIEYLPL